MVENADVIAASEKEYDKLKIAAEKEAEAARKKAEKEAEIARIRAEREAKEKAADALEAFFRSPVSEGCFGALTKLYTR